VFDPDEAATPACPFIELGDPRCGSHFTLSRLSDAFGDCMGSYRQCPHYYRLQREHPRRIIRPTLYGHTLQPTGS
jgi:hypothetical protein